MEESLRVPDSKEFKELKYDYDWVRVQEEWKITMSSYDLTHLIDPSHVVVDAETDRLQQFWLFGIMINKFKSPNSRLIVLKHKVDKDTRAIWSEVDDRNSTSMANEMNMSQLLQYISTIKLAQGITMGESFTKQVPLAFQ